MRAVDNSFDGELVIEAIVEFKLFFIDSLLIFNIFDGVVEGRWLKLYYLSKFNEC